ncbi:carboxylesterase family protein [Variovorax sp. J22G73]|uniref:carboxylesterase/lipase family protein n=1 Tax=unclassified Variovorax TaxID=663243 RepID=UPI000D5FA59F|nr:MULTISPECIES: carboxylesterase family protein [unclassified Variovorax]MDM0003171.1 carboxylesterase family protein [Variovorax sp. J22R203]MDM0097163.1 carboxylesterase family protein [Variovorax sp. J22G73]
MNTTATTQTQATTGRTAVAKAISIVAATAALAAMAALAACGGGSSGSSGVAFLPSAPPAPPPPPPPAPAPAVDGPMVRQTTAGKIEGVDDSAASGTYYWKGVPFAKPPVGALRWRAPAEPEAWTGIRPAKTFGAACLQIGRMFGPGSNNTYDATIVSTMGQPLGSEDCLFVNVWRPATTDTNLPVLLFVHGGSNISGYTADPLYDGAKLAKAANAVVITASYRLGVLGFLNVPQIRPGGTAGDDSGNFALLDNMAALRYIRDNVASFGGDPGNVTLSGESAGATNLLALMTSPMAKGLFHKAFEMSGGISMASNLATKPGAQPALVPASVSLAQGDAILKSLLIADHTVADATAAATYIASRTPAQIADYLRSKEGGALLTTVLGAGLSSVAPIPDGTVIPLNPIDAIAADQYVKVPTLAGNTREEGKLFAALLASFGGKSGWKAGVDDAQRLSLMMNFDPDASTQTLTSGDIIDASYLPVGTPLIGYNAKTQLVTSLLFEANRDNLLDTMKTRQANLWSYRLDWAQEAYPWNEVYGAAHAFDLPFVFGNFGPSVVSNVIGGKANEKGRLALSSAVMASIGAFMRKGDPNTAELGVTWAPWPAQLRFDATLTDKKITTAP